MICKMHKAWHKRVKVLHLEQTKKMFNNLEASRQA